MKEHMLLLLKQVYVSLDQYQRGRMKKLGISPSQGFVLGYLFSKRGQTVYATDLHAFYGVSKSSVSGVLKGLREKGYIVTAVTPGDDRKKQLVLTKKADEMEKQIRRDILEQQERVCRGIPEKQLEILEKGLLTMLCNMNGKERQEEKLDEDDQKIIAGTKTV